MNLILPILALLLMVGQAWGADFHKVWTGTILPHEGAFQNNPKDDGNWTGGKVGKGRQLGTKYGLSASTYGLEFARAGIAMKNITPGMAEAKFKRDFWDAYSLGMVASQALAEDLCDEIVNRGPGGGPPMLSAMFREVEWGEAKDHPGFKVPVPARYCRQTWLWLNEYTKSRKNRKIVARAFEHYRSAWYLDYVLKHPGRREYALSYWGRSID